MSKFRKNLLATAVMCVGMPLSVFAQSNDFIVKQIKVAGLQRVLPKTVMHYMPIHDGQTINDKNSIAIINALYNTGFFSDIQLNRMGNTLWVIVKERPTISSIEFSGNSKVTNKQLLKALHSSGITEGAFYDSSKLHEIVQGLKQLYQSTGHNHALINVKVKHASHNRMGLDIKINEGGVVKVSSIKIEGASNFSQKELMRHLKMHPTNILEFLSSANKYTDQGVQNDIEGLTNFYLDHGYLDFHVVSHKAILQADKKHIQLIFVISEGKPYTISKIKFDNHSHMSTSAIQRLMKIHTGDVFSRQKVIDTNAAIGNAFADKGYAFPNISMQPQVDQANHTVELTVIVAPGKQITIRYINFTGNNMTEDKTLRHDMTFSEGSPYSQANLKESRRRFYNLPFISNVAEKTVPVPGSKNLVDIDYKVSEMEAGRAQIMAGYSDTDGFLYGVSLSEPNFKGEGKSVGINLTRSQLSTGLNFNYFNPFYSIHNIGRGFELHYTKTNPKSSLNIASYDLDGYGGSLNYTFPMNNYLTFTTGIGYDRQSVKSTTYTPDSIKHFISEHNNQYNITTATTGLSFVNTDRYYFPTSGVNASLNVSGSLPVLSPNLQYYSATLKAAWYRPLNRSHSWVLVLHTNDGYGRGYGNTKYFPFMDNFYGGGIDTVPGFDPNTLGPYDKWGNSLGGNELVSYGVDLVFPNPIGHMVRTSLTINGGNVYNQMIQNNPGLNPNYTPTKPGQKKPDPSAGTQDSLSNSGPMRYSIGLRIQWQMPLLGTISFAIAHPLNAQKHDQTTWFNFNFGTSF